MSFDNGPTASTTPFVLDELNRRQIAAWFCVVGSQLERPGAVELMRRALDEGHRLANHSLTHRVALGDLSDPVQARREIREMHELMHSRLGDWGEPWFRPFGRGGSIGPHLFSAAAIEELTELGYSVLLWSSVPEDWRDTRGWVETALDDVATQAHTVLVLHDLPTGAMQQLPRFLDALADRDVHFSIEPPPACVPLAHGVPRATLDAMTAG